MEKNVGKVDVAIRLIVGFITLYLAFMYNVWWIVVTIIAFTTAYRAKCALYSLFGISTAEKTKEIAKTKVKAKSKKKK